MNTSSAHIDDDFKGDEKGQLEHIEDVTTLDAKDTIKGTVGLTNEGGAVVLIPTPSADPSGSVPYVDHTLIIRWSPLALQILSTCPGCANGLSSSSSQLDYIKANKGYQDITNLITVPTLSMVTSYEYHLGIRIVIGFAAGQSEALVPLMLKEVFFLHERANVLAFQASFQTIIGCVLTIFASNIAASVGWKNWYSVYAGLSGFLLITAYFFVPETAFDRPLSAYTGATEVMPGITTGLATLESQMPGGITQSSRPALDEVKYGPRTLRKDLRVFVKKMDWMEAYLLLKHCLEMCFFPNMLVIILMNSWYLGVNIGMGTTYATLLEAPPYNWAPKWVGVAQAGQIVVAFVALPMLGIFSDKLITYMSKRNNGVHELALGVLSTVLFGAGYAHPEMFHCLVPTTIKLGYMKAYGMYAGVMALFALLAVGLYFKGKAIRNWSMRWIKDDGDKTKPHYG
ncbi:hypothetical protein QFC21_006477 [Naganishia friedmannii]|uniref:Uncharacterized protein n=1 Tax=Naganishia friedmannii TaxID=89922 RepID=A0ACC2V3E0_9TREE|nr:hypothetical protein QFC21_006477 [Naganishia friedmannii]